MNIVCCRVVAVAALALLIAWCGIASAQLSTITITVDENCDGTILGFAGLQPLSCALLPDPGPSGFPAAVTYNLTNPPGLTAGDLVLVEVGDGVSDQIRFNPQQNGGSLVFYSDFIDGAPNALADMGDTGGAYANLLMLNEVGLEVGANGITYTPTAGQPGFVAGAALPVTYVIRSDTVPEPATLALLGIGLAGLGFARRKRKQ